MPGQKYENYDSEDALWNDSELDEKDDEFSFSQEEQDELDELLKEDIESFGRRDPF